MVGCGFSVWWVGVLVVGLFPGVCVSGFLLGVCCGCGVLGCFGGCGLAGGLIVGGVPWRGFFGVWVTPGGWLLLCGWLGWGACGVGGLGCAPVGFVWGCG